MLYNSHFLCIVRVIFALHFFVPVKILHMLWYLNAALTPSQVMCKQLLYLSHFFTEGILALLHCTLQQECL